MSSVPVAPTAPSDLPAQINAATRKQHTELNRLIIERLPLALPPTASDPATLGLGLAVFARIYYTFEAAWRDLEGLPIGEAGTHEHALHQWLLCLRPTQLDRTKRLQDDLRHISHTTSVDVDGVLKGRQQAMLDRMTRAIQSKPHILIAYAWVMYMAIFSGGRWIRGQLHAAGPHFRSAQGDFAFLEKSEHRLDAVPGIAFLSFDGEYDGEDVKAMFKLTLKEADELLTEGEKNDVIVAAGKLFEDCIELVGMLDLAVCEQNGSTKSARSTKIHVMLACLLALTVMLFWKRAWL